MSARYYAAIFEIIKSVFNFFRKNAKYQFIFAAVVVFASIFAKNMNVFISVAITLVVAFMSVIVFNPFEINKRIFARLLHGKKDFTEKIENSTYFAFSYYVYSPNKKAKDFIMQHNPKAGEIIKKFENRTITYNNAVLDARKCDGMESYVDLNYLKASMDYSWRFIKIPCALTNTESSLLSSMKGYVANKPSGPIPKLDDEIVKDAKIKMFGILNAVKGIACIVFFVLSFFSFIHVDKEYEMYNPKIHDTADNIYVDITALSTDFEYSIIGDVKYKQYNFNSDGARTRLRFEDANGNEGRIWFYNMALEEKGLGELVNCEEDRKVQLHEPVRVYCKSIGGLLQDSSFEKGRTSWPNLFWHGLGTAALVVWVILLIALPFLYAFCSSNKTRLFYILGVPYEFYTKKIEQKP